MNLNNKNNSDVKTQMKANYNFVFFNIANYEHIKENT